MTEPRRLLDTEPTDSASALEQELLESLRPHTMSKDAVWQRISGSLAAAGTVAAATSKSAATTATVAPSLLAKAGLVVALAAPVLGGAAYLWSSQSVPVAPVAAVSRPPASTEAAELPRLEQTDDAVPVATEEAKPSASRRTAEPTTRDSALIEENAMLRDARAAFRAGQPAQALALLDTLAQRQPRGTLRQERDFLRVQVLFGLGNTESAGRLGRKFLASYPKSPYAMHVTSLLQPKGQ